MRFILKPILPQIIFFIMASVMSVSKEMESITISYKDPKTNDLHYLRVIPYDDNIIRVTVGTNPSFSPHRSLVVITSPKKNLKLENYQKADTIFLKTETLVVKICKKNGNISFCTTDNKIILKESEHNGRCFIPAEVLGEKTYNVQQKFDISECEGLYGLGQHQNGIMNYRSHDIDLWQYNIVAVVPFLVSSNNYGILWDNYSRTKFGDTREYQSLEYCKLFDKSGNEGGLTAEYFSDERFETLYTSRTEKRIQHEFIDVNDPFPDGFAHNVKAVRWSGSIKCEKAGKYKFRLYCSGYTKMWLNGKLVVDSWRQNWLPWTHFPELEMKKGEKYELKIEWIHSGGYIGLQFLPPSDEVLPNSISLYSEVADQIDYYFINGNSLDDVISGYRSLTGQAPMMPKWAMGLWQCRERYRTQDELLSVVKEFRKRSIPLDNIVQDWFYWEEDKWGDHEFDASRYPNPAGMVRTLHDSLHTRIMISVWPKFYIGTRNYEEMKANGWLYMRNIEKGQKDWVGPGYVSTFYDPYSEGARLLYWKQINEKLFSLGFDAWWLDCTEPDIQSNLSRQETILRQNPTALGSGARYLNTYSLMNSQAVYEGQRKTNPHQRRACRQSEGGGECGEGGQGERRRGNEQGNNRGGKSGRFRQTAPEEDKNAGA